MKYLEYEELVKDEYYHCVTYDGEDIIVQYWGDDMFDMELNWGQIRYVLYKHKNLREIRKNYE
jgi:hypothetical protein